MKKKGGDARQRILDIAEHMFGVKGYDSVTLRDIGSAHGITHASLYYHFPGGKYQLFVEVTERSIRRHGTGLDEALSGGGPRLRGRLSAAAAWLLSRPPMDLLRMVEADLKSMQPDDERRMMDLVYGLIILRLQREFETAAKKGEIGKIDTGLVAGSVLAIVESLFSIPDFALTRSRQEMADYMIGILLKGIEYQEGETNERT